jgi:FkbM family methyltransferase
MKVSVFHSLIYNLLLKTVSFRDKNKYISKRWYSLNKYSVNKYSGAVSTSIHGFPVFVNNGYSYPFFARLFPRYNNPLLQLVYSVHELRKKKITIIDIGSAIGDTNLFLIRNLPNIIEKIYCIEGDKEFYSYLEVNEKHFCKNKLYNVLLGERDNEKIKELVKTHLGTASSIGINEFESISLDSLLYEKCYSGVDLIKIDVDGLDGKVLKGCKKILFRYKPFVIFEYHPIMIEKTGNDFHLPFDVLGELEYDRFLWYDKYGNFNHFSFNDDYLNRSEIIKLCLNNKHDYDFHYDIIAIHKDSKIDVLKLAELEYAKAKLSRY